MRRWLAVLAVLSCLAPAHALGAETWMTVMLDGRKVGMLRINRTVADDRVTTSQVIDFRLTRVNTPLSIRTEVRAEESSSGTPLSFYARSMMSSQESVVTGETRGNGEFQVDNTVGGTSRITLMTWPTDASLMEGQRLSMVSHGFRAGTSYRVRSFDAVKQQVATVDVSVIGDEQVDLPGGPETLHHLRQALAGGTTGRSIDLWVDDQGNVRRGIAPLLGFRMEMAACNEACAKAPDQDVDLLRAAMIESPRPMVPALRVAPVRYTMVVRGGYPNPFIQTDEQSVLDFGNGMFQVDVGFAKARGTEAAPTPEDTAANPWVQSDSLEVTGLATRIVGKASDDLQRMRRLRSWLSDELVEKGLDVGYASALETIHTRRGDCTEHAVLLTALARSLGIPARVVTGVVYVERYGGASRVFIPHAWMQAWVGGRWISFDSAQRRFDSTHIALGTGNGDPWRFFSATAVLGQIRIQRAVPGADLIDLPPPGTGGTMPETGSRHM